MIKIFLLSFALTVTLSSCSVVTLGEGYSQRIDDELNTYHKQASQFIKSMELNAGTPQGSFSSAEAKKFYAETSATLANIELQAALLSSRRCPAVYVQQFATTLAPPELEGEPVLTALPDVSATAGNAINGNCVSIVMHGVSLAQQNLELDHKEANKLTPTVGMLNQQQIDASVRVALTTLQAKKY